MSRFCILGAMLLGLLPFAGRPGIVWADSPEDLYERARNAYREALSAPKANQKPENWEKCIGLFQEALAADTSKKYADKCLYLIAQSYHRLFDESQDGDYLNAAQHHYRMLVQRYGDSPLADDAQYLLGILLMEKDIALAYVEFVKVGIFFPKGDMQGRAAEKVAQLKKQLGCDIAGRKTDRDDQAVKAAPAFAFASGSSALPSPPSGPSSPSRSAAPWPVPNQLRNIEYWSGEDYSRVALYVDEPVMFQRHNLPAEPKVGLPDRVYLDLKNCVVNPRLKSRIPIDDRFLQRVRIAQYDPTRVRVVLDIESMETYRIFSLDDPYRLIIDVHGKELSPEKVAKPKSAGEKGALANTLARQLGLHVKRIVLDPGHGGKDKGAIGPNGVYEKDIVLAIARKLKTAIERNTGCEVILTRTDDRFLSLEERTAIANAKKADLFVSIHTNAHEDRSLYGTETYFLNLSKDEESARVAALENATSTRKISDLEAILHDLMLNTKISESSRLAKEVQCNIINKLQKNYNGLRDLGVKQAPFYVLLGAEMPSVLIETAFISNKREERLLKSREFQENLAGGIAAGISSYIQQMKQFAHAGEGS